jgi:hypothetical protein
MPSFATLAGRRSGKTPLRLLALLLALAISTGVVNAQWIISKEGFLGEFRKKSIVGSWEELVRFPVWSSHSAAESGSDLS